MRAAWIGLLVVSVLVCTAFAGCMDDSAAAKQADAKRRGADLRAVRNMTALEEALDVRLTTSADSTSSDWWVLPGAGSADGNLTSFRWRIPTGAVIGLQRATQTGIVLEIAPIILSGSTIKQWCIMFFREQDGKAFPVGDSAIGLQVAAGGTTIPLSGVVPLYPGINCSTAYDIVTREPTQPDNRTLVPAMDRPFYLVLPDRLLQDQLDLHIVLAAASDNLTEFGVAMRLVDHFPAPGMDVAARDLETFVLLQGNRPPRGLTPRSYGSGFHVAMWMASFGVFQGNILATTEWRAGPIDVQTPVADARPAATLWNLNISSTIETASGWSMTRGSYSGTCSTGRWTASADLHGNPFMARSLILQHGLCTYNVAYIAEYLLLGQPFYLFYGGGQGAGRASLELFVAGALSEIFSFHHIAIGASLETLMGLPASGGGYVFHGVAQNVPP